MKNSYNYIIFTNAEYKSGVVVSETHPKHLLQAQTSKRASFKGLHCKVMSKGMLSSFICVFFFLTPACLLLGV